MNDVIEALQDIEDMCTEYAKKVRGAHPSSKFLAAGAQIYRDFATEFRHARQHLPAEPEKAHEKLGNIADVFRDLSDEFTAMAARAAAPGKPQLQGMAKDCESHARAVFRVQELLKPPT
jgi:hypothetical protein